MALTADQLAARAGKIGGSDIGKLMNGTAIEINDLWLEKMGEKIPKDISNEWPIFRGARTEPMHLDRQEYRLKQTISRRGETVSHYQYDWAMCTLDGWIDELRCPIEVKWTGGREPFDPVLIERYFPQCQWQMEMTGADCCALSVAVGGEDPTMEMIKRDALYAKQMLERGWIFIQHVRNRTPPVDLPMVPLPVDATRIVDMHGNNEFAAQAGIWLDLRDSATAYDDAAKILKSLVPPDAKRCFGYGVQITRNRLGNLSLRELRE